VEWGTGASLHGTNPEPLMSALPPKADILPRRLDGVHAAIAWSPEALAHVSKSSAAAGVAANQTVEVKARAASVPRRIGVIAMSLWTITSSVDHIATARSHHGYLRAAPYLLMRWSGHAHARSTIEADKGHQRRILDATA